LGGGELAVSEYALKLSEEEVARYERMAEAAADTERDLWTAAGIVPGAVVADVGCGPGAISVVLARLVAPSGRVIAVDREPSTVEAARRAGVAARTSNLSVQVGAADETGIEPASVDVVMIRHVLAHNGGREEAIVRHAAALVRPGGSVYLTDAEVTAVRMRPSDPDVEDQNDRYRRWHDSRGNDLSVGLRLGELLATAGLEVRRHEGRYQIATAPPGFRPPSWAARDALVAAGLASHADLDRWAAAFARLDTIQPRPTMFVPLFMAFGQKPL
jgi:SAM-dependent methyltransferase